MPPHATTASPVGGSPSRPGGSPAATAASPTRPGVVPARPTYVVARLSAASAFFLGAGLVLARPDMVALGAPFTVALFLAVWRGRRVRASVTARLAGEEVFEGSAVAGTVVLRTSGALDAVRIDVGLGPGLVMPSGTARRLVAVRAREEILIDLGVVAARWGRTWVGPVQVTAYTAGTAFRLDLPDAARQRLVVLPATERFESEASLPYAVAAAGMHRSASRGDALEFAGLRPFVFGDRLRRVSWPTTARTGRLHVVDSHTERASDVVVLVDSAQDVGESGGIFGSASSLDGAVRAAASITAHHLRRGDSVQLVGVGNRLRFLRRLTGRRDLVLAFDWLLDTTMVEVGAAWAPDLVAQRVPARSVVLALTPLLDERMTTLVARLRQRGQPVVVVDTLPPGAVPSRLDQYERLGLRLWLMERERTVALLTEHGCPVIAWSSRGALDRALRLVGDAATSSRVGVR